MSKGNVKVKHGGRTGIVTNRTQPDYSYLYETSLVKDSEFNIGDRVVLPDGREFAYSKSSGVVSSGAGAEFVATGAIPYTLLSAAQAIGDKQLSFVASTHDAIAKDELRGGYCVTWPAALKDQTRGIIGNDASAENAAITIYLDARLSVAVTVATPGEVYENPYANLINTGTGSASRAKAGIAATYVGAASTYFWVQVRGFVFIAPQSDVITNVTGCYFRHDGSIEADIDVEDRAAGSNSTQYAGHRVIGDYDNNGPLFYLQG